VTSAFPMGRGEPFLIPEVRQLRRLGHNVLLVPVMPTGGVFHEEARDLVELSRVESVLALSVLGRAFQSTLHRPRMALRAVRPIVFAGRPLKILLKNAAVLPKSLWLARVIEEFGADHVHAFWSSTPATVAMVAARMAQIPWSFTAHRWDIDENNLMALKAASACFVRAIDARGAAQVREQTSDRATPTVIHLGVDVTTRHAATETRSEEDQPLRLVTAANFVEKKGHRYLIEALSSLERRGISILADWFGDGPAKPSIARELTGRGLDDVVSLHRSLSHDELMHYMRDGRWDLGVLPSVNTASGETEGIPMFLVESMAAGMAVIGTEVGGIPELLADGAGLVIPERDPQALADAIELLARDRRLLAEFAKTGAARVADRFAVEVTVSQILSRFEACSRSAG
jgi:colanic acid/amylovoran biosynthesis glycosyltransferase